MDSSATCFRPHVWGFFFHISGIVIDIVIEAIVVFVPMYGDSFFTIENKTSGFMGNIERVFVPMYGDSFFTYRERGTFNSDFQNVFVPMYGDSFFTG